jgi:hypothetical protein
MFHRLSIQPEMVQGRKHRRQQQAALKVVPAIQSHLPWVAEGLGPNLGRGIHSAVESRRRVAAPKNNNHKGSGSGTFHVEHYRVKQRPRLGHRHISDHQAAQSLRFHYPSQAPTSPASPANPLQDAPHISKRDHIKEQPRSFCRNGGAIATYRSVATRAPTEPSAPDRPEVCSTWNMARSRRSTQRVHRNDSPQRGLRLTVDNHRL